MSLDALFTEDQQSRSKLIENIFNTPQENVVETPVVVKPTKETGYIEGGLKSLQRGLLGIQEQAGQAMEWNADYQATIPQGGTTGDESLLSPMNRIGKVIKESAEAGKDWVGTPDAGNNYLKKSTFSALESAPPSLAYKIPGFVGAVLGSAVAPVAGTAAGAVLGQIPSSAVMYRSAAQEAADGFRKIDPNVDPVKALEAAKKSGHYEWAGEGVSDIASNVIFARLPGVQSGIKLAKEALIPTAKTFFKNMAMSLPAENIGEGFTTWGQTNASNEIMPANSQIDMKEALLDTLGSTTIMTGILGVGGHGIQRLRGNRIAATLESAEADPGERGKAAGQIYGALLQGEKDNLLPTGTADTFATKAYDAIGGLTETGSQPYALNLSDPDLLKQPGAEAAAAEPVAVAQPIVQAESTIGDAVGRNEDGTPQVTGALTGALATVSEVPISQVTPQQQTTETAATAPATNNYTPQNIPELAPPPVDGWKNFDLGNVGLPAEQSIVITDPKGESENGSMQPVQQEVVGQTPQVSSVRQQNDIASLISNARSQRGISTLPANAGINTTGNEVIPNGEVRRQEEKIVEPPATSTEVSGLQAVAQDGTSVPTTATTLNDKLTKANELKYKTSGIERLLQRDELDSDFHEHLLDVSLPHAERFNALMEQTNGNPTGMELANKDNTRYAMITPDASEQGKTRITYFDKDGFSSHSVYDNATKAAEEATREGYFTPAKGTLSALQQTKDFQRGNEVATLMGEYNQGKISFEKFNELRNALYNETPAAETPTVETPARKLTYPTVKKQATALGVELSSMQQGGTFVANGQIFQNLAAVKEHLDTIKPENVKTTHSTSDGTVAEIPLPVFKEFHSAMVAPENNVFTIVKGAVAGGKTKPATDSMFTKVFSQQFPSLFTSGSNPQAKYDKKDIQAVIQSFANGGVVDSFKSDNRRAIAQHIIDDIANMQEMAAEIREESETTEAAIEDLYNDNYDPTDDPFATEEEIRAFKEKQNGAIAKDEGLVATTDTRTTEQSQGTRPQVQENRDKPEGTQTDVRAETTDDAGGLKQQIALEGERRNATIGGVQKQGGQSVGTSDFMDGFTPDPNQDLFSQPKSTVSENKIFTEDAAAKARALLKSKLNQLNSGLDPEIIQAGITLAGYHIEKGARTFAAYAKEMINDLGEAVRPYLKSWYMGVKYDPRAAGLTGIDDAATVESADVATIGQEVSDVTGNGINLERDSQNSETQNTVGEGSVQSSGGRHNRGLGEGVEPARGEGISLASQSGISYGETAFVGEHSDQSIHSGDGTGRLTSSPAGDILGQRGSVSGLNGAPFDPVAPEAVDKTATRTLSLKEKQAAQLAAQQITIIPGDAQNIDESVPFLLPGQKQDVKFAEDRFAKGHGVLFTNGTGTGKTYTGLGIIKRFERQGKTNILIVAPSDSILKAWGESSKNLHLNVSKLKDTKDSGNGIVMTTYANFRDNSSLVTRKWDLIVFDESDNINKNAAGTKTASHIAMQALTLHPEGVSARARMKNPELWLEAEDITKQMDELRGAGNALKYNHLNMRRSALWDKQSELLDETKAEVEAAQDGGRTKVAFLSATPFAYEKSVQYANGYLFDWDEGQKKDETRKYNGGDNYQRFMMRHFGYTMKYNKLTEPSPNVDRGIMQRQFNSWLKSTGSLSGRMLDSEYDYDRKFVTIDSAIGRTIDEGFEWLREHTRMRPIEKIIQDQFNYLSRRYLLESIKAQASIPIIKEHLALGRKVVIFHDYNKGGGLNPFDLSEFMHSTERVTYHDGGVQSEYLGILVREFMAARPDLLELPFNKYESPINALTKSFPDLIQINGLTAKKQRDQNIMDFQTDNNGKDVILVQSDAGGAGISLHDTTGVHQRVILNLGLPTKPTTAIQQEGRIYRVGQASDAMFRYFNTGTNWERFAFATAIATKTSGAENLAAGENARAMKDAFIDGFMESSEYKPGHEGEGKGGKERDSAANNALTEWDKAVTRYWATTKGRKNDMGTDYFATPNPLGFKMVEWADIRPGEYTLEPSAADGEGIARYLPENAHRKVIEPSIELSSKLAMIGIDPKDIIQGRFEDLHIGANKFDVIVMNPPFGTGGKTAIEHLEKAEKHLKDGGRIVALIPSGASMDKRLEKWLYEGTTETVEPIGIVNGRALYAGDTIKFAAFASPAGMSGTGTVTRVIDNTTVFFKNSKGSGSVQSSKITSSEKTGTRSVTKTNDLTMVADVLLPSSTFTRAGTQVYTHIVVLDKNSSSTTPSITRDLSDVGNVEELFARIKDMELPPRSTAVTPTREAAPVASENVVATEANPIATGFKQETIKHTKTGANLYTVKMSKQVSEAEYKAISAKVTANKGYWSRFAKAFIFDNIENRAAFLEQMGDGVQYSKMDAAIEYAKYNGVSDEITGNIDTSITDHQKGLLKRESAQAVEVKGENADALRKIGKAFGLQVLFYRVTSEGKDIQQGRVAKGTGTVTGSEALPDLLDKTAQGKDNQPEGNIKDGKTNGFFAKSANNTIFLNVDSDQHLSFILGHELSHSMGVNNPAAYAKMMSDLAPFLDSKRYAELDRQLVSAGEHKGLSSTQRHDEFISNLMGELFTDKSILSKIAEKNPSLFQKIYHHFMLLFKKATKIFTHWADHNAVVTDLNAAHDRMVAALVEYSKRDATNGTTNLSNDIQYSRISDATATVRDSLSGITVDSIKSALHPVGFPARLVKNIESVFPSAVDIATRIFSTPVSEAKRDARTRKSDEVGKLDFVEVGTNRAMNNSNIMLDFMGYDGQNANRPDLMQRIKSTVTEWESSDVTTEYGRIEKEVRTGLSESQQAALDVMQSEGDVRGVVYASLAQTLKNPRIAATNPSLSVFHAYKRVRDFIDNDMAAARERAIEELGKITGTDRTTVANTIKAYREHLGKLKGWMPRKHGEGTHQVNVYHTIKALPFSSQTFEDGHIAVLPFYAGKEVQGEISRFARANGLLQSRDYTGAPIVIADNRTKDKISENIAKLEIKKDATKIEENKAEFQEKIDALKEKLAIVSRPSHERIADFITASRSFLGNVRTKYETDIQALRDERSQAEAEGAHKGKIREIKQRMESRGDGNIKVKVYMRLNESESQASKLKAKVAADLKGHLEHVYHPGEEYTTTYKVTAPLSEGTYSDLNGTMAVESLIEDAIKKASQTGNISPAAADSVKKALFRGTADALLQRGAGRHQIKRADYLIQGYDKENTTQIFRDYMSGAAGMISKAMYARQQFENYRYAPNDIKPWAERYIKNNLRNMGRLDRVGGDVRAVATFMYLGFKVSSILINMTQSWTLGVAELGRRTKQNSVATIAKTQWDILNNKITDQGENDFLNDNIWREQEMATAIHENSGAGEGTTGKVSKFLHTLVGKSLMPFQEVEMLNRKTMALAAYRAFMADGMSREDAIKNAMDVNQETNFEMSRANLPEWAHNPVGRTAYALQSFVFNNWNWIYKQATSSEKADIAALLKYSAMLAAIGGVSALAGGDEINKLIRRLTGKDYKLAMQNWTRKNAKQYGTAGELLNAMVWHGGVGALGVNISNAMRLNVPMSGWITGDTTAGESAMGIWSGIYNKGANTARYASRGQFDKAFESAAPAAIEAPLKAYRMYSEGATTSHGKPVFDEHGKPLKYSAMDAAKRALGLQPLGQSERAEVTQSLIKTKTYWSEERSTLLDAYRVANKEKRKEVMRDIMKFNRDVRKSQVYPSVNIIQQSTLTKSIAAAKPDQNKISVARSFLE